MKVRPVLRKSSEIDEIRLIRIDESAIQELLFETLMENSSEWFQVAIGGRQRQLVRRSTAAVR